MEWKIEAGCKIAKSLFWTLHLQVGQRFNSHCVMKKEAITFASYVCLSMVNIPLIPK